MTFDSLLEMDNDSPLLDQYHNYDYPPKNGILIFYTFGTSYTFYTRYSTSHSLLNSTYPFILVNLIMSLSFLSACSLCFVSFLNALNVFSILNPSLYLLNLVQGFFGLLIIVSTGDGYSFLENYSNVVEAYMGFLSVKRGRGIFFVLVALLSYTLVTLSTLYYVELLVFVVLAILTLV
uniref:Integral membrane protein, putative n=1 Tax=Theileria annulata TaxID=5874 RepID=A0A3B0N474_THEAN